MKSRFQNLSNQFFIRLGFLFGTFGILFFSVATYFHTYGEFVSRIDDASVGLGLTGIVDNVVTIDNMLSDYYYYMGLNYTDSDGTLPTSVDKGIYSDSNLVQVKITYSSRDINNGNRGYVSLSERQDTYVYYKMYPVMDNDTTDTSDDYVLIELIDNPFTDRPRDKGFNGWVTSYEGAFIQYDDSYYTRYVKVPVTRTDGIVDTVDITMNASWTLANVGYVNSSSNWNNAFSELYEKQMQQTAPVLYKNIYGDVYMDSNYYHQVTIAWFGSCSGYYNSSGQRQNNNCTCRTWGGCTYYEQISNELFDENSTYYTLVDRNMTLVDNSTIERPIIGTEEVVNDSIDSGSNMAGYYKKVNISFRSSIIGYYDVYGVLQERGVCNTSGGCEYYELIQYYDNNGNVSLYNEEDYYYYLATRDTNIIVMNGNVSNSWGSGNNKPFTLTSVYNGTDYRNSVTWDVATYSNGWFGGSFSGSAINCYNDTGIENIKLSVNTGLFDDDTSPTGSTNTAGVLYGNYHNVKVGRGITREGDYASLDSVFGGSNGASGSSDNSTRFKLIVESGFYNTMSLTNGQTSNSTASYVEGRGIYGSDYDKASANNDNLIISYAACGSWGGVFYTSSPVGVGFDVVVRSGSFGVNQYDNFSGIYVGGRGNSNGRHYTARRIKMEGGYVYNLIGGPITGNNRSQYNDTYMYITGGEIDMVYGGAGTTATYGNRIIQMTGGIVNYSIFGGSNGVTAGDGDGTVNGSSYIYVGGNARVGKEDYVSSNQELAGAEAGSIFGIGNGNSSYETIGSLDNSIIIVADDACIKKNVYGGGNYAAVGISSTNNSTRTDLKIVGGVVEGSIYGGGNKNGSGSTSKSSEVTILMTDGEVNGSIYGGANQRGIIYGDVNVSIYGGKVKGSVYGGGLGGYTSSNDFGTFVGNNVNVVIGSDSYETSPVILGNVYGGSSFGTVNNTVNNSNKTDSVVNVTVNKGKISGSVFGGGAGSDTFTPNVNGDVLVTINHGEVGNVFGANDQAGMPLGSVRVVINNGEVGNVFGGGNKTSLTTSDVTINHGTVGKVFGGSNEQGVVDEANIVVNDGVITSLYGGNNIGGHTLVSNVLVDGGTLGDVYGGGSLAITDETNLQCNGGEIQNVYGGGESADINTSTSIDLNGSTIVNVYGGSNTSGEVASSNIRANAGNVGVIYGGNNEGGTTDTTEVHIDGVNVLSVYGGGNQADTNESNVIIRSNTGKIEEVYGGGRMSSVSNSNVDINGGFIGRVFGGSNTSGEVTDSNVRVFDASDATSNQDVDMQVSYTAHSASSWESTEYATVVDVSVNIINNGSSSILEYDGMICLDDAVLYHNYSSTDVVLENGTIRFDEINRYYGTNVISAGSSYSFSFSLLTNQDANNIQLGYSFIGYDEGENRYISNSGIMVDTLYGGNNAGGKTVSSNVSANTGVIGYIYGGGNEAITTESVVLVNGAYIFHDVYGGGNQALIETSTDVDILSGSKIDGNVFGGGNAGEVTIDADVYISGATVLGSAYAGGNGMSAIVYGNTLMNVDNGSEIGKHVFGGGNAAITGSASTNHANSVVNIVGGRISGNVYGGANTSVVYGEVDVNIGMDASSNQDLIKSDILIGGTVFGGGEANASGSEEYDYSFISVTKGITIDIDGYGYSQFDIMGSIFGSGNASSTSGYSNVNILNYGNFSNYKKNVSIQRADVVVISNSAIELSGATDRTNDFADVLFSLSRIDDLKLKNGSVLFLQNNANLLKKFESLVDVNGKEEVASVIIDSESQTIDKNVDNRLYMLEGENLNVATNENVTAYGEVSGMTFFGMYTHDRDGVVSTAMYSPNYRYGEVVDSSELYYFTSGSYVLGMHKINHNIEVDGFYSNYASEEVENAIDVRYINPMPEDSNYYMWVIGESVASYEVDLTASKYVTLGTSELPLLNHYKENSTFSIVGFNYDDLASDVRLVSEYDVPRIADSTDDADKVMGLTLKSGTSGWITKGKTEFLTEGSSLISGTTDYLRENTSGVPSFVLYLYHSKNLGSSGDMGSVTISLMVSTPIDELTNEVERVNIVVNLSRALYNTNDYEATITAGREYEMFATSDVHITNTGSFSTYYSLYMESDNNPYQEGYHRTLVSDVVFPENTKITMIDLVTRSDPEYYYYVVSSDDVVSASEEFNTYGEVSYDFSKFVKMGSTDSGNKYRDSSANQVYYDSSLKSAHEEFIFIVDFNEASLSSDVLNKSLLIEMRNTDNRTVINVLGASQTSMKYSVYVNRDAVIDVGAQLNKSYVYPGDSVNLLINTDFIQGSVDGNIIYDTTYADKQLGIKLTFYDSNGIQVTGASLLGVSFTYDGKNYYPRVDGTTRIHIAPRVANVSSKILINTTSNVSVGDYKLVIESFGSADGIYYGLTSSDKTEVDLAVLDNLYGLDVIMDDKMMIIEKDTGNTLNDNNKIIYQLDYDSNLSNPVVRISLYRRDYDAIDSLSYTKVDLLDYVSNSFLGSNHEFEYILTDNPEASIDYFMDLKSDLKSGTYRLVFSMYDGDNYIGEVYKYLIIK